MKPEMPTKAEKTAGAGNAVKILRIVLGAAGAALIGYGLLGLPTQLGPPQLLGLLVWMAVAVLLHDGVIVPVSTVAGGGLTRLGSGLRPASAAVLRGALMTGVVVTVIAGILLKAQSVARNTSALEGDYAAHLLWFWVVLAGLAAVLAYGIERTGPGRGEREQKTRP
ncbi:hypothetical protein [Arthrobacter oryzae]|uniref:Uncharacterized protein n=1 Tax=Arthrobacter oryzae TaxID=409290 RepID=A0A495EAY1_9MICC|nr:hypothetical protein [Arthrobacter oryzae]RKR13739.1 hypothetical protein C8D78_3400 [Arthrobacter oryzae]